MAAGRAGVGSMREVCAAILGGRFVGIRTGCGLSERFTSELDAMHALHYAIEDGIGDGGVPDPGLRLEKTRLAITCEILFQQPVSMGDGSTA